MRNSLANAGYTMISMLNISYGCCGIRNLSEMAKKAVRMESSFWTSWHLLVLYPSGTGRGPRIKWIDGYLIPVGTRLKKRHCQSARSPKYTPILTPNAFTLSPLEFGCNPREKCVEWRLFPSFQWNEDLKAEERGWVQKNKEIVPFALWNCASVISSFRNH